MCQHEKNPKNPYRSETKETLPNQALRIKGSLFSDKLVFITQQDLQFDQNRKPE
jgi:hypothetical protein